MNIFKTAFELDNHINSLRKRGIKIGFVPTMGALHNGHLSLLNISNTANDYTVVSVFVNKLQFNDKIDFDNYPNNIQTDLELLESNGCEIVFIPSSDEMYPGNFKDINIDLGLLNQVLEGKSRPGHYFGVVQAVYRLFSIVKPDFAYFGLKDFQQCMVVKLLRDSFFTNIHLEFCPTMRDESGLALSSRNQRLSKTGKLAASSLYQVLNIMEKLSKHIEAFDALKYGRHVLKEKGIETEYFELVHADSFLSSKKWFKKGKNVVLIAAYVEGVRLIDNVQF